MGESKKSVGDIVAGPHPAAGVIGGLIFTFISLLILLLIGEYLWNKVLVKLVTVVKPVTSVWQILGLSVLFKLMAC
jgi:hypothetical protein